MSNFTTFVPLAKIDLAARQVWGWAAEEAPDKAGEIMDYAASKLHFAAWSKEIEGASGGKSLGNVRSMHGNVAAGKLVALEARDDLKKFWIGAKIVDDAEWRKCEEGVYTGFSVGGRYGKRWPDPNDARLVRYEAVPFEISLVDNPCMPGARFEVVKIDGTTEIRNFGKASYPWDKCMADQTRRYGSAETARKVCGMIRHKYGKADQGDDEAPIEYDGDLDFILREIEAELDIEPAESSRGGDPVSKEAGKAAVDALAQAAAEATQGEMDKGQGDAGLHHEPVQLSPDAAHSLDMAAAVATDADAPRTVDDELAKAGSTFISSNQAAAHGAIKALAAMLSAAGDETAAAVAACYEQGSGEAAEKIAPAIELDKIQGTVIDLVAMAKADALAATDGKLAKLVGDVASVAAAVEEMAARLERLEKSPVGGGPVLRSVPQAAAPAGGRSDADALAEVLAGVSDPQLRAELGQRLTAMQIRTTQAAGGHRVSIQGN